MFLERLSGPELSGHQLPSGLLVTSGIAARAGESCCGCSLMDETTATQTRFLLPAADLEAVMLWILPSRMIWNGARGAQPAGSLIAEFCQADGSLGTSRCLLTGTIEQQCAHHLLQTWAVAARKRSQTEQSLSRLPLARACRSQDRAPCHTPSDCEIQVHQTAESGNVQACRHSLLAVTWMYWLLATTVFKVKVALRVCRCQQDAYLVVHGMGMQRQSRRPALA